MKRAVPFLAILILFGLVTGAALGQATSESIEKLRACSVLAPTERLECLRELSRDLAPPLSPHPSGSPAMTPAADVWIVSMTTSPIDYTPVGIATSTSGAVPDGTVLRLTLQCRAGRSELAIGGPSLTRPKEDYRVSYTVNDGPPVAIASGASALGVGVTFKEDVRRLLASLPDQGEIAFRVVASDGSALEGRYALAALKSLLHRMAAPCGWSASADASRN
jgi:hypothetical protein